MTYGRTAISGNGQTFIIEALTECASLVLCLRETLLQTDQW